MATAVRKESAEYKQKVEFVKELNASLKESEVLLVVKNKGMTVAQVSTLRKNVRKVGATYRVSKNRLTMRAVKDTPFENVVDLLKGPTAIGYAKEPVAVAKVLVEFAKANEQLELVGGVFGSQKLDAKGIEALSKLPSLDELRAKIIAMIQTPATRIAGVVQAPAGQIARVVGAYSKKG